MALSTLDSSNLRAQRMPRARPQIRGTRPVRSRAGPRRAPTRKRRDGVRFRVLSINEDWETSEPYSPTISATAFRTGPTFAPSATAANVRTIERAVVRVRGKNHENRAKMNVAGRAFPRTRRSHDEILKRDNRRIQGT